MEKNYPIQIVETRGAQDIFLKEGMRNNNLPDWATQEIIKSHASSMYRTLSNLEEIFDRRDATNLPILLSAKLDDKALVKTFRPNAKSLFDERDNKNVIGVRRHGELIIKVNDKQSLLKIKQNVSADTLNQVGKVKQCGIAAISDLLLFHPEVDDVSDGCVKVKLVDYQDSKLNERSEQYVLEKCEQYGIPISRIECVSDLRLYKATIASVADVHSLATLDSVLSVKRIPYFEVTLSPDEFSTPLDVKLPKDDEKYPLVGLLDSGVEDIPHLRPWLIDDNQNEAGLSSGDIDTFHGTAVASILNYGDELQNAQWTKCSPVKIKSFIVNTSEFKAKIDELEMLIYIHSAISSNSSIKVWNLSQGSMVEIDDDCFSDFAIELDAIQKKYNVLICKSAGNVYYQNPAEIRITHGADSVRSIVVGSVAHDCVGERDVEMNLRSSFSRVGPGPMHITKPDMVHYGGNNDCGVSALSNTGYQGNLYRGTSFSTPRVSSLAANLVQRLGGDFDPILIKALLIHGATYPNTGGLNAKGLLREMGHGIPGDIDSILFNNPDEFTMIWHPDLSSSDVQIKDLPFPSSMIDENGFFYGDITVTLVTDPFLKGTEGSEYCQSNVDILLQTYDSIQYFVPNAVGTPRIFRNFDRIAGQQNVLAKSLYGKASFKKGAHNERTLIESAQKFNPVKKYHVNLEKMTPANRRKYLSSDKKWCMSLETLYRDASQVNENNSVKVVVIVTIKDTRNKGVAYNECIQLLDLNNFTHSDIVLENRLKVENR